MGIVSSVMIGETSRDTGDTGERRAFEVRLLRKPPDMSEKTVTGVSGPEWRVVLPIGLLAMMELSFNEYGEEIVEAIDTLSSSSAMAGIVLGSLLVVSAAISYSGVLGR